MISFKNLHLISIPAPSGPPASVNVAETDYDAITTATSSFNFTASLGSGDGSRTAFFLITAGRNDTTPFSISAITVDGVAPTLLFHTYYNQILIAAYAIKLSSVSNPTELTAAVAITMDSSINRGVSLFTAVTSDTVSLNPYYSNTAYTETTTSLSTTNDMNANTVNGAAVIGWCGAYADNIDSNKNFTWSGLTEVDEQQYSAGPGRRVGLALASNVSIQTPRAISVTGTVADTPDNFGVFVSAVLVLVPSN